jgi:hypothetical protein
MFVVGGLAHWAGGMSPALGILVRSLTKIIFCSVFKQIERNLAMLLVAPEHPVFDLS